MGTSQLAFTEAELLTTHDIADPLIARGVRCHGGFDSDGRYVSPRTKHRGPAIAAWQQAHHERFGTELLAVPLETWPEHYPNVAQARYLLAEGISDLLALTLTRIGTVEGFGAMVRHLPVPDFHQTLADGFDGTALAHLDGGLFEAHARDEAGYEDEGGHREMWYAARDIAFENPELPDQTDVMRQRMAMNQQTEYERVLPADVSIDMELLAERMTRILLIEIQAFHTFAWAEALLSDRELVAGEGEAARLVAHVRADETPHVEYLKTALTELRDRTWLGESGRRYDGSDMIGRIWDRALRESMTTRRAANRRVVQSDVELILDGRPRASDIAHRFHELENGAAG